MVSLKRLLQLCVLSACTLSSTMVFADESSVSKKDMAASNFQTAETLAPEALDFGNLGTPEPINLSCTATSQCTPTGGPPTTCNGVTNCSSAGNWVTCDSVITYCGCTPSAVPTCADGAGFCNCWNTYHNWASCRQGYCLGE